MTRKILLVLILAVAIQGLVPVLGSADTRAQSPWRHHGYVFWWDYGQWPFVSCCGFLGDMPDPYSAEWSPWDAGWYCGFGGSWLYWDQGWWGYGGGWYRPYGAYPSVMREIARHRPGRHRNEPYLFAVKAFKPIPTRTGGSAVTARPNRPHGPKVTRPPRTEPGYQTRSARPPATRPAPSTGAQGSTQPRKTKR